MRTLIFAVIMLGVIMFWIEKGDENGKKHLCFQAKQIDSSIYWNDGCFYENSKTKEKIKDTELLKILGKEKTQ